MNFGTELRDARLALGLSLEATAKRAGCSASYVHKLELDRVRTPSPRVLDRLAKVLDVDYSRLMLSAGYRAVSAARPAKTIKPSREVEKPSNAAILRVLLDIRRDVASLKALVAKP